MMRQRLLNGSHVTFSFVCLNSDDATKIRFNKSGHYIIIGGVAGCLKESLHESNVEHGHLPVIHLDICNSFGAPLRREF
jgi:hypothetical protein